MKIYLLSKDENLYTTRRFINAGSHLGIDLEHLNPLFIGINMNDQSSELYYENKRKDPPHGIINRFGIRGYPYGALISHFCKANEIPAINPFDSIIFGKNKIIALNIAKKLKILIPDTFIPPYASDLRAIERKVPPPYIVKIQSGTQGIGVMLARDIPTLQGIADYLWDKNEIFMIQHFFDDKEMDIEVRLLFFDYHLLGGFSKKSHYNDFRSNFHRGGNIKPYKPGHDLIEKCHTLLRSTGIRFAGIDFIIKKDKKAVFLEINESPGFEAFEKVNGKYVAEKVIKLFAKSIEDHNKPFSESHLSL